MAPSFIAYNNMGLVYSARGDNAGAIEQYRRSIQMDGDYELSHNNLGASLLEFGLNDEAMHPQAATVRFASENILVS